MAKWVTYESKVSCLHKFYSSEESRLVTVKHGTPIDVVPTGYFTPPFPLFRLFDSVAFVSMTPKQVEVEIKGNAGTSDGVAVQGRVSVQVVVKDDLQIIKRMVVDAEGEENLLRDSIVTAIQETIASHTWHKVVSVGEELTKATEEKLLELLQLSNSCFMVRSLTIQEIRPQNKEFADSLEKAARAREDEKLQKELATPLCAERAVFERAGKKRRSRR